MKKNLILLIIITTLSIPAFAECTRDSSCGRETPACGSVNWAVSNALYDDWSELMCVESYCSASGEILTYSCEAWCPEGDDAPCEARDDLNKGAAVSRELHHDREAKKAEFRVSD